MEKITSIYELKEGTCVMYKHSGKPMCIIRITYNSGKNFVRYKTLRTYFDNQIHSWDIVNKYKDMYKLNNEEVIAYMI